MRIRVNHQPSGGKEWVAKITGKHPQYKFEREFLTADDREWSSTGKTGWTYYEVEEGEIYEVNEPWHGRYFIVVENGKIKEIHTEEVLRMVEAMEEAKKETQKKEEKEEIEAIEEEKQETIEKERREKGSRFSDGEIAEFLIHYINQKGFGKDGKVRLDSSIWVSLVPVQVMRVAKALGYECEFEDGIYYFWKAEKKEENQKEEKEMGNEKERRILIDFIEEEIMDKGFDEDGEFLINVSDVTNFSDEEIIEVVENLGLCCEKAEGDGNFWISLPEEYILSHQNLMEIYFDNQGPMTDDEMFEVLDYYINAHRKELEEFGCITLDTYRWSYVDIEQIERVAGYLHFDCHCKGYEEEDWDGYITLYPWK